MCELLTAVREGRLDKTKELLELEMFYTLPSWNQGQGIVLLREALVRGHSEIAKLLLSKGARVNNKFRNSTNDPLHFAVGLRPDNAEIIKLLIDEGAKINSPNGDGSTPLHLAVSANNEAAVTLLLENQAIPDIEDHSRVTPLHVAAERGLSKMAELLLGNGAKPDVPLTNGFTPLHLACIHARYETVSVLVRHAADVNACSDEGTPLDLSFPNGELLNYPAQRSLIVSILLKAGAKANAIDNNGKTILHRAVEKNCLDLVTVTLPYANINALSLDVTHKCLQSPVQIAVERGFIEIAELLIAFGADINMPCSTALGGNYTLLHLACSYGHISIIERILKRNVDLEVKTLEGRTPLHAAAIHFKDNTEILLQMVQLLFDAGAKISTVDQDESTILHSAVENQCLPLVELIFRLISKTSIDVKQFVNSVTVGGLTPLHIAAAHGSVEIAEFLLNNGANINSVSTSASDRFSPLHVASKHIHIDIIKLFLSRGGDVNALSTLKQTPAHVVLSFPDNFSHRYLQKALSSLAVLLENGGDLDWVDDNGDTILNLAVKLRCLGAVQTILDFKPDPKNPANRRALRTAVITGTKFSDDVFCGFSFNLRIGAVKENRNVIQILEDYGLVFNKCDILNNEVLHHAIRKGYINVVQFLLDHGADVKAVTDLGTPLHSAVSMLQEDIIKLLVSLGADVNAQDNSGKMPIYHVTEKIEKLKMFNDFGDSQICLSVARELLSNGADLRDESRFLIIATQKKDRELVRMALNCNADVNVVGQNGWTALHAAIVTGDKYLVKLLLDHGAGIEARNNESRTALLISLTQRQVNLPIINLLLEMGAKVDVIDNLCHTPLHYAAMWGSVPVIEQLLDLGANIEARDSKNVTPLILAADRGRGKAVIALLRRGANPNAKRFDDSTALHLAARWSDHTVVENLIYFGADPQARTFSSMTPLAVSLQECYPKVVRLLLENGGHTPDLCCSLAGVPWFITPKGRCLEISEILHSHFLKLEALKLWPQHWCLWFKRVVCSGNRDEEIEKLKSKTIVKGVYYYDIISKPKSQLVSFARNERILDSLSKVNLLEEFPVFGKLLEYSWESAVSREKLLSSGIMAFNSLMIESILSKNDNKLDVSLKENLSTSGNGWLFDYLKIIDGTEQISQMSTQDFALCLRRIQSLLPVAIVEKIVGHLSDDDLENMALSVPNAHNEPVTSPT